MPVTKHGMPGARFRHAGAVANSGASGMWNGPSTVLGVAPATRRLLMSSTSMLTPMVSDSRMNSWRLSSHFWPMAVRNSIASNHSAPVGRTSLTKACRCLIADCITSRRRGSGMSSQRFRTALVCFSSDG